MNPCVFVVGCPRSGTTLLQRMLDAHPLLAVANDTHFIPRPIERQAEHVDPPLTQELVEWVRGYRRFCRLGLPDAAVRRAAREARTYGGFVSHLYSEYGKLRGKPLAGEKTPDYARYLPLLHRLFPWVKSVHIIRDGRDVALSALEWAAGGKGPGKLELWRQEPVAVCALWWRWQVRVGRRDGRDVGPAGYREIKYEELLTDTSGTLKGLADFLELPFAPEMLAYHVGKTRHNPRFSAKNAWLPPTPGLRDWRVEMPERELELFEAIAGDLLADLGYERAVKAISPRIRAVAEDCRGWWTREMEGRRARRAGDLGSTMYEPAGVA